MSKSSLFILSFNFHYVSLMLKFSDPAKRERGGKKRKSMPKKKVGKSVPKERGGGKVCRRERKRAEKKGRDMPKKGEGIVRCGNRR